MEVSQPAPSVVGTLGDAESRSRRLEALVYQFFGEEGSSPSDTCSFLPAVAPFFPREVYGGVSKWLEAATQDRGTLYLRGRREGVGTSYLVDHWAEAENYRRDPSGRTSPVVVIRFGGEVQSVKLGVVSLANELREPFTPFDLRHRDAVSLAHRLLGTLAQEGTRMLVLDHVGELKPQARKLLGTLLLGSRPDYQHRVRGISRVNIGMTFVSHLTMEAMFASAPATMNYMDYGPLRFDGYQTLVQVAAGLRLADVGLEDLCLDRIDDMVMTMLTLDFTEGLTPLIHRLLRHVSRLLRLHDRVRPTPADFFSAVAIERGFRETVLTHGDPSEADVDETMQRAETLRDEVRAGKPLGTAGRTARHLSPPEEDTPPVKDTRKAAVKRNEAQAEAEGAAAVIRRPRRAVTDGG